VTEAGNDVLAAHQSEQESPVVDAHAHLAEEVSEVRRMLYRFIQSLNAESG
jgi:hypothetical protein